MKKYPDRTEEWYREILDGSREVFIYSIDGEFIGEIALFEKKSDSDYYIPGNRIYISRMIVKKEHRNKGIGGTLIDFICDFAKNKGFSEISLGVDNVNMSARHLYAKKGFLNELFHGTDEHGEFYKLMKKL